MDLNSIFQLIENTHRSIFLTGKAGTGKTTFLNDFVKKTQKKHIIVAPTGIAAINAGGSTIHSMFGLPLRPFAPTYERIDQNLANNITDLVPHFHYRKQKIKLFRTLEIIIIDEVSMLRADVLDMMDLALRICRRNTQPFGGVQMLFIGDLHQLPPIVRDENILKNYYESLFFFDSLALKKLPLISIELTTVYRQKDEYFLNILNSIREGKHNNIDFKTLNEQYDPDFNPKDSYIYLTSHNKIADGINTEKLNELNHSSFFYEAQITGDFKTSQYPNDPKIELKVGAQIMFIRNDSSGEKKYYNGKLGIVTFLNEKEIRVRIEGETQDYKLKKEIWENKTYVLDKDNNIQEQVLGSFEHYPIRLAWAITIHKSQGLTFDKVIIDAGQSFTSGQVYVALSRCRTLEGIVLKSKITPDSIFSNHQVKYFEQSTHANEKVQEILETEKYDYAIEKIIQRIDSFWIQEALEKWHKTAITSRSLDKLIVQNLYDTIRTENIKLIEIHKKFEKIIRQKIIQFAQKKQPWQEIENKCKGAVNFFFEKIFLLVFQPLKDLYGTTKKNENLRQHNQILGSFLDEMEDFLSEIKAIQLFDEILFENKKNLVSKNDKIKTPSHILTYQMVEMGKSIDEISKQRNLSIGTIYGHLARYAENFEMDLEKIFSKEKIQTFGKIFSQNKNLKTLTEWKEILPKDFEFNEIRLFVNYFTFRENSEKN